MAKRKNHAPLLPTEVYDDYYIRVKRVDEYNYPQPTERCGKWLIYAHISEVDHVWVTIRDAVVGGLLGSSAKVATMMYNPREVRPGYKVICVYTYDSDDLEDLKRVLVGMREIGINQEAWYKEDRTTRAGQYSSNSKGPVTKYRAPENSTEFFPTKTGSGMSRQRRKYPESR